MNSTSRTRPSLSIFVFYAILTGCGDDGSSCCGSHTSTDLRTSAPITSKSSSENVSPSAFPLQASIEVTQAGGRVTLVAFSDSGAAGTMSFAFEDKSSTETKDLSGVQLSILQDDFKIVDVRNNQELINLSSDHRFYILGWSPTDNHLLLYNTLSGSKILTVDSASSVVTSTSLSSESLPKWLPDGRLLTLGDSSTDPDLKVFKVRSRELEVEKSIEAEVSTIREWSQNQPALYRLTLTARDSANNIIRTTLFDSEGLYGTYDVCIGNDGETIYAGEYAINSTSGEMRLATHECVEQNEATTTSFDGNYRAENTKGAAVWSGSITYTVNTGGIDEKILSTKECHSSYAVGDLEITYALELTSENGDTIRQEGAIDWSQSKASCEPDHCG